jgi:hypothetical protein
MGFCQRISDLDGMLQCFVRSKPHVISKNPVCNEYVRKLEF